MNDHGWMDNAAYAAVGGIVMLAAVAGTKLGWKSDVDVGDVVQAATTLIVAIWIAMYVARKDRRLATRSDVLIEWVKEVHEHLGRAHNLLAGVSGLLPMETAKDVVRHSQEAVVSFDEFKSALLTHGVDESVVESCADGLRVYWTMAGSSNPLDSVNDDWDRRMREAYRTARHRLRALSLHVMR